MNIRKFIKEDYIDYADWMMHRGRTFLALDDLPEDGLIVEDNDEKFAIGFIYDLTGSVCSFASLSSNPYLPDNKRSKGVEALIDGMMDEAKIMGFTSVYMTTNKKKLLERLNTRGFIQYDQGLIQVGRKL